jgi:hypothetical protein
VGNGVRPFGAKAEKIVMTRRYPIILICSLVLALLPAASAPAADNGDSLMWVCAGYFEKRIDRAEASYGIRNYRERFLATKTGAMRRAFFVFPVAFRVVREHLRSQSETRFGEAGFAEYPAFDLGTDVAAAPGGAGKQASGMPMKPGDQVAALPGDAGRAGSAAAIRIVTKPYNGVPSHNGWSELTMMALDGRPILGDDSTVVVVWRHDTAEEWGTGTSGSLLDFGRHRAGTTYVTSTEFALMERMKKLYGTPFTVFALSPKGPLSNDAARLDAARAWLKRYKEDPTDPKLQTVRPSRC